MDEKYVEWLELSVLADIELRCALGKLDIEEVDELLAIHSIVIEKLIREFRSEYEE